MRRSSISRRGGSAAPEAVRPFDEADRGGEGLLEPELGDLAGAAEAVEVGVPELDRPEVVGLHERVGRRGDLLGAAERRQPGADQGAREVALAGAEPAGQAQHVTGAEMRGEGAAEPFGGGRIRERQG